MPINIFPACRPYQKTRLFPNKPFCPQTRIRWQVDFSLILGILISTLIGIWDVYSNQRVVDRLIDHCCLATHCEWGGVGCDNMKFMIVALLGGKTKDEWYDMISKRLQCGEGYHTPRNFPQPTGSRH
ncbi:uncharacterized protein VP01_1257g3 [Puccinia sorghi]|uniref:Uncharacterized protein n=1 Tax=Puccinia sorghi TaxID=27349 RepID=A0A0L6VPA4_9BASI|nr:uncharacterized protein VP01_1257g3 [Puccinia sorghi]